MCLMCIVCFSSHAFENKNWINTLTTYKEVWRAKFSVFFFDIYQSRLLTETGSFNFSQKPYLFEITYLKDITSEDLIGRTVEQWQHLSISESQYQPFIKQLASLWPDISAGDKLAIRVTNKKSKFYFNDVLLGDITNDTFGDMFVSIWLSPNTSQPELRHQLLGTR